MWDAIAGRVPVWARVGQGRQQDSWRDTQP